MIVTIGEKAATAMRMSVKIDADLMERAMKLTGLSTKRETVEEGLKLLIRLAEQQGLRRAR